MDIGALNEKIKSESAFINLIKNEISKVIVGQQNLVEKLLVGILADGHILVEGVPGLAKTLAIKTLASAINAKFQRIQFTPDLLPADLIGTQIYNQKDGNFSVKKGPIFANLILADEINRAPAKVQSALLEAMQEKQVTIGNETFKIPEPFLVMATQNPIEQEGTYPLPEAQIDRFMLKVKITYPSYSEEAQILNLNVEQKPYEVKSVINIDQILKAREFVREIYMDEKIKNYILDIVSVTREPKDISINISNKKGTYSSVNQENEFETKSSIFKNKKNKKSTRKEVTEYLLKDLIIYGASPRATLALSLGAKAIAFIRNRGFVIPDDVKAIAHEVLRHRIILSFEAEAQQITTEDIINQILESVQVP